MIGKECVWIEIWKLNSKCEKFLCDFQNYFKIITPQRNFDPNGTKPFQLKISFEPEKIIKIYSIEVGCDTFQINNFWHTSKTIYHEKLHNFCDILWEKGTHKTFFNVFNVCIWKDIFLHKNFHHVNPFLFLYLFSTKKIFLCCLLVVFFPFSDLLFNFFKENLGAFLMFGNVGMLGKATNFLGQA